MSSPANIQYETLRAYILNKKAIAAAYTLKVGSDDDLFQIDNPVNVNVASTYTIIVPNGVESGQEIFFYVSARTGSEVVTVATTKGDDLTLDAVGEYACLKWLDSTTGWKKVYYTSGV